MRYLFYFGLFSQERKCTDVVCANQHGAQYSQVELVNTKTRNVEGLFRSHAYGNLPNPISSRFFQQKKKSFKSDHLQGKADAERCDDLCSTTDLSVHCFIIQTSLSLSLSLSLSHTHTHARAHNFPFSDDYWFCYSFLSMKHNVKVCQPWEMVW